MKIAESILGQMAAPVLVIHEYSHAIFANPAFYDAFNVRAGTLRDKSPQEVLLGEPEGSQLRTILETVMKFEQNFDGVVLESPDNRSVYSMSSRRLTFEGRSTDIMLVEMFDITRERERESKIRELNDTLLERKVELERINEDLESFTHSASHDLRTPLRLINRVSNLLIERHASSLPPDALELIAAISTSTQAVGELLEKLLAFSRVNHAAMRKRRIDLAKLTSQVAGELAEAQLLNISEVTIEDLPFVFADHTLLKQVMFNLLSNAAKFTRRRENIEIRVGQTLKDGESVFFVRDNGVGFDMADVGAMFAPFRRLKSARNYEGTGIGLAFVKRIVDHHGGHISAEGFPGGGATIYFTLGKRGTEERGPSASRPIENTLTP